MSDFERAEYFLDEADRATEARRRAAAAGNELDAQLYRKRSEEYRRLGNQLLDAVIGFSPLSRVAG